MKRNFAIAVIALLLPAVVFGCRREDVDTSGQPRPTSEEAAGTSGGAAPGGAAPAASGSVDEIAAARGLSPADVENAVKTYMPSGKLDDYIMFASGGHSGQVLAVGLPSMRLLKVIAVFSPESWQGWGVGADSTERTLDGGNAGDQKLRWADTHHPALSETAGDYDGQFLFIGDKANARIAVIDLRDFETKQIVKNPVGDIDHGGMFVTPNTEWVVEGGQYAQPLGGGYAPMEEYKDKYRGHITFWKFDREKGRVDPAQSFAMEVPPYWQDLCDSGKLESEGWIFCNSINTELATGKDADGNGVNFESGVSQNDMDYMHVVNLQRAAEVATQAGKTTEVNGFKVIPLQTSIDEQLLWFVPEPKSPHGADVAPKGDYIVVGGKLDQNATVYSFKKIQDAIAAGQWDTDDYGVPVLPFDAVMEAQVPLGAGPLHTQFDDKGYAYTSMFLDSTVNRWTLGGDYRQDGAEPWKLVTATPVQYNVGHIAAAEGDTVSPDGNFLVALNKWSIDRFANVGPLLPQNFQLLDIAGTGENMPVMYDMPIGNAEPHYAQIIKADKLKAFETYPEVPWDTETMAKAAEGAPVAGNEKVVRDGNNVEVWMTAVRSHFTPERLNFKKGDNVTLHITNIETARDATHGFAIPVHNINLSLEPGETATTTFVADTEGAFPYFCTEFCSALHLEMVGYMLVEPGQAAQR